jgi:glycosyltransferase involved in cell wall biosynthesis
MIHLFFPVGNGTGWDICGKYLTLELSKLSEVALVTSSRIAPDQIGDELEHFLISQLPINTVNATRFDGQANLLKGTSIRTLNDSDLSLWLGDIGSERTIGYTFYTGDFVPAAKLEAAQGLDLVVAGSTFCERQLVEIGLQRTRVIVQGVNSQVFNAAHAEKSFLHDRFVIFSGGKFEFRKGQDIVIKAFKIFSERHPDALLVNSWFNFWESSLNTMAVSPFIEFAFDTNDYFGSMQKLYRINGIDPSRVITLPLKPPFQLPHVLKNTDVGLFPNRCEGGTNLMLMEYMACGKPVIATAGTGHADMVCEETAFPLIGNQSVSLREGDPTPYRGWIEPELDQILGLLEIAYDDQTLCRRKGEAAAEFLSRFTWQKAASKFYQASRELP